MKNQKLTKIALRYRALYLDMNRKDIDMSSEATVPVLAFAARLKENGYTLSEELVRALSVAKTDVLISITETINDVMGCSLNWAPLVKGWDVPTGESYIDHLITLFVNVCNLKEEVEGITLPCEEPFFSVEDLQIRAKLTKSVVDVLRNSGALEGLDETDQLTFF